MIMTEEDRSIWRKTLSTSTLSTTNLMWTGLESNPDLRGERLATNRLSHCTADLKKGSILNVI